MKLLQTDVADLGYLESGPAERFPVLMLHGFPDDALAWKASLPISITSLCVCCGPTCAVTGRAWSRHPRRKAALTQRWAKTRSISPMRSG